MSRPISSNLPDIPSPLPVVDSPKSENGKRPNGNRQKAMSPCQASWRDRWANNIMEGSIMLVLSRKVGESIVISESIRVTVVQVNNGRIRLGIDAPPEVIVLREELTRSCSNSSPSKNGEAEALPRSAQLPLIIQVQPALPVR